MTSRKEDGDSIIVSFDPYDDGSGIMRDAQSAKPQTLRTGDGRFACTLAACLAQI